MSVAAAHHLDALGAILQFHQRREELLVRVAADAQLTEVVATTSERAACHGHEAAMLWTAREVFDLVELFIMLKKQLVRAAFRARYWPDGAAVSLAPHKYLVVVVQGRGVTVPALDLSRDQVLD